MMSQRGQAVMDPSKEAFRKEVYGRLERENPRQWEELRGCTVTHSVFGEGTVSKVMMPDWSNPVHLSVKFGLREKTFHLSSFGDRTKFVADNLPERLAEALARAEEEIAGEERRLEEDLQRREHEARETVLRKKEKEANRVEDQRQAEARQEAIRAEQAETRLAGICEKAQADQPLTGEEIRILIENRRHDLLLAYHERAYARGSDYRAMVKAATIWRDARQPEYALRVTDLTLQDIERRSGTARALILTARGGAFLDLHRLTEARECALKAIESDGKSPQPSHLLGMILMESGEVAEADAQFTKARELAGTPGASRFEKVQHAEVKKLLQAYSLDSARQKTFAQELLRVDPQRYEWVASYLR